MGWGAQSRHVVQMVAVLAGCSREVLAGCQGNHFKLANEWVWSMVKVVNPTEVMEEPLTQVSNASLQQKWKYGSHKKSIVSRLSV